MPRGYGLLFAAALFSTAVALAEAEGSRPLGASGSFEPAFKSEHRTAIEDATVSLAKPGCTAFVAHRPTLIVTAAHCIVDDAQWVGVKTRDRDVWARVEHVDRDADVALLRLDAPLKVEPLALSTKLPRRGAPVLFVGHPDRPDRAQVARVERLARCPSLPGVPDAIFTSVDALPGDSGSPLVDAELRVVGVIHGGARCHIATPIAPLARLLERDSDTIGAIPKLATRAPEVAPKPFWQLVGPAFWLHLKDAWAEVRELSSDE